MADAAGRNPVRVFFSGRRLCRRPAAACGQPRSRGIVRRAAAGLRHIRHPLKSNRRRHGAAVVNASWMVFTSRQERPPYIKNRCLRARRWRRNFNVMGYLTVEVEIDHGHVLAKGPESLPEKASGLLTIFRPDAVDRTGIPPLQALESLQKHLRLDATQAMEWMTAVREARR